MALAPETGKLLWMTRDEPAVPSESRQVTPIGLGFMPLTREATPLHSSLNRHGFSEGFMPLTREATPLHSSLNRHGFSEEFMPLTHEATPLHSSPNPHGFSEDLCLALQKLFKQAHSGSAVAAGADKTPADQAAYKPQLGMPADGALTDQAAYKPQLGMPRAARASLLVSDEKPAPPSE
eukprot:CAMPEP_0179057276 /NCGR_PEP_ID=MMETSP0796-20121207/24251_1 /TAXON_ID=73915 /ORGANISM="Pyrodinium bahamense, Strain pbaha01" /LENGTH=178 /DNA_ID=CAMNT_0020753991 /DNA_START=15 /DNA_END=548 /DNA_ORIENTATION=+